MRQFRKIKILDNDSDISDMFADISPEDLVSEDELPTSGEFIIIDSRSCGISSVRKAMGHNYKNISEKKN